jgi:hypothetical protein
MAAMAYTTAWHRSVNVEVVQSAETDRGDKEFIPPFIF